MERLTDRTEKGSICLNNNGYCGFIEQLIKAIDKLAEFEDFMEEQRFESLEELKINIEYLKDKIKTDKFNYEQLHKFKNHLQQENQALKDRWEKLKKYIIEQLEYDEEEIKVISNLPNRFYITVEEMILNKMKELEE